MKAETWTVLGVLLVGAGCTATPGSSEETADSDTTGSGDMGTDSSGSSGDTSTEDTDTETDTDTEGTDTDTGVPDLCDDAELFVNPDPGALGHSEITHWKYDRAAVLTINFDDSTPGQAQVGVPAMIERGFTGTWFVNPGNLAYMDNQDTWDTLAPANFQELANHSMHHSGASTYAEAEQEIGDAAAVIRAAYPPERSPMMAFNKGGDTTWDISDAEYQQLLEQFYCEERLYSSGITPATPGQTIYTELKAYMQAEIPADNWTKIHFHGLCDPADLENCVCDTLGQTSNCREFGMSQVNNGAISATEFVHFLDQLVADPYFAEQVWVAGFIGAYKYQQAREVSQAVVAETNETQLSLCLTSDLDPALYDEALTVSTQVPDSWSGCEVSQAGVDGDCRLVGTTALFEVRIDAGVITLSGS